MTARPLNHFLPDSVRRTLKKLRAYWYAHNGRARMVLQSAAKRHALPAELVVSLTSYPARFDTLHLTLHCLLNQSVRPDRILLWIAHQDAPQLTDPVKNLTRYGVEIRLCEDVRSFKKLIFTLQSFPHAYIVTADDDLYYRDSWLETLVSEVKPSEPTILCHRAHRLRRLEDGRIAPYSLWQRDVGDENARMPSSDILPTSGAGVLYPPHSLHEMVIERALFQRLCMDGDDLWFYWAGRLKGSLCKKVGPKMPIISWPASQEISLWEANEAGGNDRMIESLDAEFGSDWLR